MTESYLHKIAKELLYKEIVKKNRFEFKINDVCNVPLGNHGIYMEFPSMDISDGGGWYPDECGCIKYDRCIYKKNEHEKIFLFNNGTKYTAGTDRYSLTENPGYCKCGKCNYLRHDDMIIHDIASIHKGSVVFAIEIINKHMPEWRKMESNLNYMVYLVRAVDVLKRVNDTPVYVFCLMGKNNWTVG